MSWVQLVLKNKNWDKWFSLKRSEYFSSLLTSLELACAEKCLVRNNKRPFSHFWPFPQIGMVLLIARDVHSVKGLKREQAGHLCCWTGTLSGSGGGAHVLDVCFCPAASWPKRLFFLIPWNLQSLEEEQSHEKDKEPTAFVWVDSFTLINKNTKAGWVPLSILLQFTGLDWSQDDTRKDLALKSSWHSAVQVFRGSK